MLDSPAPTMTLDMPRHRLKNPSVLAMWNVLRMTLVEAGVVLGLRICIRVWEAWVRIEVGGRQQVGYTNLDRIDGIHDGVLLYGEGAVSIGQRVEWGSRSSIRLCRRRRLLPCSVAGRSWAEGIHS